jgi:hypothetical protein
MRPIQPVYEIEVTSAKATVSYDGRFAVIAFVSPLPNAAHYRMTLARKDFDRLALQIAREQKRVRRPARSQSLAQNGAT